MDKETIKTIITEQAERLKRIQEGTEREVLENIKRYARMPHTVVISGIRRSGKSTLLVQIMRSLGQKGYYCNFEDERFLDFCVDDFNSLYEVFIELYGERNIFFFDEIQNIPKWERFARRMNDSGHKLYITGSNASLLSREYGTSLTGRHIIVALYPFSFREFLRFSGYIIDPNYTRLTRKKAVIRRHFNRYMELGGMPEYVAFQNQESLKEVYNDILYRDIVARYDIKDVTSLRELALYILSNTATLISNNRLKKFLSLGSVNTVKKYMSYLENSFLFYTISLYTHSVKQQIVNPKKVYCVDPSFVNVMAFRSSEDKGRILENIVFLELKRRGEEIYYYKTKDGFEVDFLLRKGTKITGLMQVSWNISDRQTKDRETKALLSAMRELNVKRGVILTDNEYEEIKVGKEVISVIPVYQWLLTV